MLLPFPQRWPVRCAKCHHKGEISASVADLAVKVLKCERCGHRQGFSAEMIKPRQRAAGTHGRKARAARAVLATMAPGELDDPVSDLWAARG